MKIKRYHIQLIHRECEANTQDKTNGTKVISYAKWNGQIIYSRAQMTKSSSQFFHHDDASQAL